MHEPQNVQEKYGYCIAFMLCSGIPISFGKEDRYHEQRSCCLRCQESDAMSTESHLDALHNALDKAYDAVIGGIPLPSFGRVEAAADSYRKRGGTLHHQAGSVITTHVTLAATTGFVTGLGGLLTLPIALPANIAGVLALQLRMIATIACLGEYDVHDDQVRAFCFVCLCGNSAGKVLKSVGAQAGTKAAQRGLERLPFAMIKQINQAVGFRLITKFGRTGVINLGKAIPLVGGVVNGGFDGVSTRIIGNTARNLFIGAS